MDYEISDGVQREVSRHDEPPHSPPASAMRQDKPRGRVRKYRQDGSGPSVTAPPMCAMKQLSITVGLVGVATGHVGGPLKFENRAKSACGLVQHLIDTSPEPEASAGRGRCGVEPIKKDAQR